jgi:outer membrane protein assembly factor BamA
VTASDPAATVPKAWDLGVLPIVAYAPETSLALGASAVVFGNEAMAGDAGPRHDDQLALSVTGTLRQQFFATIDGLTYWRQERFQLGVQGGAGHFPNRFWGVGNDSADAAEDLYTQSVAALRVNFGVRVLSDVYAGFGVSGGFYGTGDVGPGGAVEAYLTGRKRAGHLIGGGPFLKRDTRDDFIFPRSGALSAFSALISRAAVGSDYDYDIYEFDQRNYLALGRRLVLAFEGYGRWARGGFVPLDDLSALGGATRLRGFFEGRYRDRLYLMSQLELRVHVAWRLSAAPFVAIGDVYSRFASVTLDSFKPAGGLGLRVNIKRERQLNVRLDFAMSSTSSGLYLGLGEAF